MSSSSIEEANADMVIRHKIRRHHAAFKNKNKNKNKKKEEEK